MKNIGAWMSAAQWESSSVQIKPVVKKTYVKNEQKVEIMLLKYQTTITNTKCL